MPNTENASPLGQIKELIEESVQRANEIKVELGDLFTAEILKKPTARITRAELDRVAKQMLNTLRTAEPEASNETQDD